jgi:hypothetical protein
MADALAERLRQIAAEKESLLIELDHIRVVLEVNSKSRIKSIMASLAHLGNQILDLREAADLISRSCQNCFWGGTAVDSYCQHVDADDEPCRLILVCGRWEPRA